jgi:hypothetical protein
MRIFDIKQHVFLSNDCIEKARLFAEKVLPTVNYRDTYQTVDKKIGEDHFVSKLGEIAVAHVFRQYGCNVIGPDFNIYPGKHKSWDDDLFVDGVGIAVKTQSKQSAENYGLSWTFQDAPTRRDRILDNPEAWLCFVECNYTTQPYLCIVYPPVQLKMVVFGEPKKAILKGKKRVVYAEQNQHLWSVNIF